MADNLSGDQSCELLDFHELEARSVEDTKCKYVRQVSNQIVVAVATMIPSRRCS